MSSTPRIALAAAALSLVCALAPAARAQSTNPLFELVTQANAPIFVADPGDGRLFIVERAGYIRIFASGALQPEDSTAFLDIHGVVNTAGEGGLTSMAFDPNFASNHFVYVMYTRTSTVANVVLESVVARYTVSANPDQLDPASAKELLVQPAPPGPSFTNHKGGQLQFGPDHMLYLGFGDGGSANDPGCRAQTRNVFFGKLLRIDPSGTGFGVGGVGYGIPSGNPFPTGLDPNDPNNFAPEIWALGLRNPWRFSFDRMSGDLWIGDVGQDAREEIDLQDANASGGRNYGWSAEEGLIAGPGIANCPAYVKPHGDSGYTPPIFDYAHTDEPNLPNHPHRSITGGYVYRGSLAPAWQGRYLFADFETTQVFALRKNGSSWARAELSKGDLTGPASFGEGSDGELYIADLIQGWVYRLRLDRVSSKQQEACIVKLNQGFASLADTSSKLVLQCVAKAAKGKLSGSDIETCAANAAKLGKRSARNAATEDKRCSTPPAFGYSSAENGNAQAIAADPDVMHMILGPDLDASIVAKSADKDMAACQKAVLAGVSACQHARRAEFVACKKQGLKKDTIVGADGLAGCVTEDSKGRVAKVCDATTGKLAKKTIEKSCSARGVDLSAAFPGCGTADPAALAQCIEGIGACQSCLMFQGADALPADACTALCE